ncbi:MAG: formyltetrahydrofolate deformylase [Leadbetterella sp.]
MLNYILLMKGPDAKGLIFQVTRVLFENNCNILKQDEYVSPDGQFFMRTAFTYEGELNNDKVLGDLRVGIPQPEIEFTLNPSTSKKLLLFCTKEHHCLSEIITRQYFGEIPAEIVGVISNHNVLEPYVAKFGIPYHYIPAEGLTREEHEEKVFEIADAYSFDHMVLAKYMRILTPTFVGRYADKIINIHHSFLPAFIGANPYKQAHDRGVKIIGATAHFVNDQLDEGPIIAQSTKEIDHRYSAIDMAREGRDVEKMVLVHALKLVLADRVFVHNNRTIIL